MQNYPTIDEYRASEVVIENLKVSKDMVLGEVGKAYDAIDENIDKSTIAACAEALGILQILKDSTIDYCKNRKQFGQAIGKNQSIQHRLVDMMIEYEQSKSILYMACTVDLSDTNERKKAVSAAKARIGKAIKFVGENAIQLHGGMGMVDGWDEVLCVCCCCCCFVLCCCCCVCCFCCFCFCFCCLLCCCFCCCC